MGEQGLHVLLLALLRARGAVLRGCHACLGCHLLDIAGSRTVQHVVPAVLHGASTQMRESMKTEPAGFLAQHSGLP